MTKWGKVSIYNSGPQGFSETLYAYTSQANNNGSAFAGYTGFLQPADAHQFGITFADLLGGLTMLAAASCRCSPCWRSPARWPASGHPGGPGHAPHRLADVRRRPGVRDLDRGPPHLRPRASSSDPWSRPAPTTSSDMRELRIAAIAAVVMTLVLGVAYPLVMTGVSQVLFPGAADGSLAARRQDCRLEADRPGLLQEQGLLPEPPVGHGLQPVRHVFNNQGPNQQDLADQLKGFVEDYLKRERPYTPNLTAAQIPLDAVTTSASGVDPQISEANARIQANRVASERDLPLDRVMQIVDDHASRPLFGLGGPKSINVLEANLALDEAGKS